MKVRYQPAMDYTYRFLRFLWLIGLISFTTYQGRLQSVGRVHFNPNT